jgi:light-regulated signal transduction histidine kinase (bacteriophytochrome)
MEALEVLRRAGLDIPLILVSGALGDVTAVECIKRGATDYVLKDGLARLPEAVRRALQERHLLRLRRQAEEDLARKVEELARSNAELEQFAYIASHDLQEPLRMVATYTQLLAERYRGRLDENADKFIGYACEGALRMQALVQDLLAFSRVGRSGGACGCVNCNAALAEVLQSLGPAMKESGAVVTHGALPVVWADRSQVTQVFQNLIGNAIKFRGKEAPAISVQAEEVGRQWLFSVSDNGIGIAPEYAENIFVVFQRLHTRTEYAGNGIGLAICKKIIERHGGRIWVEAQAGRGSIFKFTMPCDGLAAKELCGQEVPMSSPGAVSDASAHSNGATGVSPVQPGEDARRSTGNSSSTVVTISRSRC